MAALHRAFALEQMRCPPKDVREDLHLDMPHGVGKPLTALSRQRHIESDSTPTRQLPAGTTGRNGRAGGRGLTRCSAGWDNPTMIVTLDEKRRLTVPLALAPTTPGDAFDARFDDEEDAIVFRRIKRRGKSWLDVIKACPVPMEGLPPRSREYPRKPRL